MGLGAGGLTHKAKYRVYIGVIYGLYRGHMGTHD